MALMSVGCSKKNWVCRCTYDADGRLFEESNYRLTTEDAESSCDNRDKLPEISCTLKEN